MNLLVRRQWPPAVQLGLSDASGTRGERDCDAGVVWLADNLVVMCGITRGSSVKVLKKWKQKLDHHVKI